MQKYNGNHGNSLLKYGIIKKSTELNKKIP